MNTFRHKHIACDIAGYGGSFVLRATANQFVPNRAVVFIHGFNGSARKTWTDFISLVDSPSTDQWWETADLYFFHYRWKSIFREISRNSMYVLEFVQKMMLQPSIPDELVELKWPPLPENFQYDEIILVGHSEGGLLLRKAIVAVAEDDETIRAYRDAEARTAMPRPEPHGLLKSKLRLFAPAIGGSDLSGLLGFAASTSFISNVLRISSARNQMAPESVVLSTSRAATEEYANLLRMDCFAAHIMWADHDAVIVSEKYFRDLACRNYTAHTNHENVCKPTRKYLRPLIFVKNGVKNGNC